MDSGAGDAIKNTIEYLDGSYITKGHIKVRPVAEYSIRTFILFGILVHVYHISVKVQCYTQYHTHPPRICYQGR